MSTFTPGPWWATESGVREIGGYICFVNHPTRYPNQDDRYAKEIAERESNKYVLAAAPDLYEALKNLLEDTQHKEHADCDSGPCPVREARAALAKAGGKA